MGPLANRNNEGCLTILGLEMETSGGGGSTSTISGVKENRAQIGTDAFLTLQQKIEEGSVMHNLQKVVRLIITVYFIHRQSRLLGALWLLIICFMLHWPQTDVRSTYCSVLFTHRLMRVSQIVLCGSPTNWCAFPNCYVLFTFLFSVLYFHYEASVWTRTISVSACRACLRLWEGRNDIRMS